MMKKKIVIPTPEEVGQHSGSADGPVPSDSQTGPDGAGQVRAESQAANQPGGTGQTGGTQEGAQENAALAEAQEYKDKYLRAVAELSNYRKRMEKEREESLRYASSGLIRSLLGVLDDLDRMVTSSREHPDNTAAIVDGAKLTAESFRKVLREHHVTLIDAKGQPFNPAEHEAMMQQPSEQYSTPTVVQVVQDGYKFHDRVIRPARVIVSMPKASE